MSDNQKDPSSEGNAEQYQFSDEDIDRELSQLDDDHVENIDTDDLLNVSDEQEVEVDAAGNDLSSFSEAQSNTEAKSVNKLQALVSNFKKIDFRHLTRKQILIVILIGIVFLLIFVGMLHAPKKSAASADQSFDQVPQGGSAIQPTPSKSVSHVQLPTFANPSKTPQTEQNNSESSLGDHFTDGQDALQSSIAEPSTQKGQAVNTQQMNAIRANIHSLQENEERTTSKLNMMSSKIASLQSDVGSINHQLLMLSERNMRSENAVTSQEAPAQNVMISSKSPKPQTESQSQASYHAPAAVDPDVTYQVEAVIPGRAWLKASNHQTLSVTLHNRIPGYGYVVAINAYNGNVTTSTGVVLKYGEGA